MENLDVNILIQVFNEKINSLNTELIVKEATIKQLMIEMESLQAVAEKPKNIKDSEDFE